MSESGCRGRCAITFTMAGLLGLLSACMVGPEYRRPIAPSSEAFKEELPDGWKEAQPNDKPDRGAWWNVYNDAQLNRLEEKISISNQNVLAAEARFQAAAAAVRTARSALFPSVTTEPAATRLQASSGLEQARTSYILPIEVSYQADVWGNIRRSAAANTAVAQASAADLGNVRLLYQAQLAADYFQIQGLDAERDLLDAAVKSYEQYVQLTQDRYEGGITSMADVDLARTQLETTRVQLIDLRLQRAQFEHAIAVLIGTPPSDVSISPEQDSSSPPVIEVGIPSALLERRPDIASAERQVAAANEQIGIARAALYPSLIFNASGGSQSAAIGDLLAWPTRFWSVGPQLMQSVFDAGKRRAEVRQARAGYDATVANYRQTILTAFEQVEDSLAQLRILSEEADAETVAVKAAEQTLDISTIQYRGGLTNYLQVITAQTSLLQNQRAAVQIQTRREVASVSLIQALGGGWDTSQLPSSRDLRQ
jgi:NodT family efflux transporter outer membrane factor (OMF) lipoprotein